MPVEKNYKKLALSSLWLVLIFAKIVQFTVLPEKYFYDSKVILENSIQITNNIDNSYRFTAIIFKTINIFGFNSLIEWTIFLTVVFMPVIYKSVKKNVSRLDLYGFCFVEVSIFLLGIYVLNISKDIIQFIFFVIIYMILATSKIKRDKTRLILCSILFALESLIFRRYYILAAVFSIALYFMMISTNKKRDKKRKVFLTFLMIILILTVFMLIAQIMMPREYINVISVRHVSNLYREGSTDAITQINDLINTSNQSLSLIIWIANYIINSIRMMFPIELVVKGVKYWPFVIYQMYVTFYLFKAVKEIDLNTEKRNRFVGLCVIIAFFLTSFVFEPDFGSWVRHESAAFPLIMFVFYSHKLSPIKLNQTQSDRANYMSAISQIM